MMPLVRKSRDTFTASSFNAPFRREHEEKPRDTFTVSINAQERTRLEDDKKILNQEKDSTALKQLAYIGSKVIHDNKIMAICYIIMNNKRKNERLGIPTFD